MRWGRFSATGSAESVGVAAARPQHGVKPGMTIKTMNMDRTQGLQASVVKATGRCSAGPPGAQRLVGNARCGVWHCTGRYLHAAGWSPEAHGSAGSTRSDNGTGEKLKGLRFDARCVRVASWTVPKHFQRSVRRAALQSSRCIRHRSGPRGWIEKLPIGLPLVVWQACAPGVSGLLSLLWFRIWVRARKTDAVGMHGRCGFVRVGPDGRTGMLISESLQRHCGCNCLYSRRCVSRQISRGLRGFLTGCYKTLKCKCGRPQSSELLVSCKVFLSGRHFGRENRRAHQRSPAQLRMMLSGN